MENKQTAIDFLWTKASSGEHLTPEDFEQAKAMEKQQMFECWETAHQAGRFEGKGIAIENWQTFEQYYNETYTND